MSHPAPHPDRWVPEHICGTVFRDPFEPEARPVRRIPSEAIMPEVTEAVIDLIALEEAELAEQLQSARLRAAMDAYAEGADLAADTCRLSRYALDVCEHGRLRRRALAAGGTL